MLLYADDCVTLDINEIRIPWYWFPTAQTKHIELNKIRSVRGETLCWSQKVGWGSSLFDWTWWSCDFHRRKATPAIFVDYKGGFMRAGISPKSGKDIEAFKTFLRILRRILPNDIEVTIDNNPVERDSTVQINEIE